MAQTTDSAPVSYMSQTQRDRSMSPSSIKANAFKQDRQNAVTAATRTTSTTRTSNGVINKTSAEFHKSNSPSSTNQKTSSGVNEIMRVTYAEGFNRTAKEADIRSRTIGHYVVGKSLGQGTFGKVRVGTHTITGELVAIKILEKDKIKDKSDVERVTREINILKKVRHPNVIQLYEIIETSRQLFLIMEYAPGGELFDYIVKRKKLKDQEACKFFQQIISGVEYIHKAGICHRDLKPENLLLDENKNIKIVDFGLSNTYNPGGKLKTACGSPCYAAPEMIAGKLYDGQKTDTWSCGIILYAMVCGYLPFEDPNTNKLYKKILSCDYHIPSFISNSARDLIKKVLNTDPIKRATFSEIRHHEWYTKITSVEMEGIIIGKDRIPVIKEMVDLLKNHFQGENLEQATTFIQNNKHNQVASTYYLLMKKRERMTGKNYMFEQVTLDKRKSLYSQDSSANQRLTSSNFKAKNTTVTQTSQSEARPSIVMRDQVVAKRIQELVNKPAFSPGNFNVTTMKLATESSTRASPVGGKFASEANKTNSFIGRPKGNFSLDLGEQTQNNTTVGGATANTREITSLSSRVPQHKSIFNHKRDSAVSTISGGNNSLIMNSAFQNNSYQVKEQIIKNVIGQNRLNQRKQKALKVVARGQLPHDSKNGSPLNMSPQRPILNPLMTVKAGFNNGGAINIQQNTFKNNEALQIHQQNKKLFETQNQFQTYRDNMKSHPQTVASKMGGLSLGNTAPSTALTNPTTDHTSKPAGRRGFGQTLTGGTIAGFNQREPIRQLFLEERGKHQSLPHRKSDNLSSVHPATKHGLFNNTAKGRIFHQASNSVSYQSTPTPKTILFHERKHSETSRMRNNSTNPSQQGGHLTVNSITLPRKLPGEAYKNNFFTETGIKFNQASFL